MEKIFITVSKDNYKALLNINESNENFYKIAFINDGSGIITRGQLYINSPYFIEVVDDVPVQQENNTIYLIKEK